MLFLLLSLLHFSNKLCNEDTGDGVIRHIVVVDIGALVFFVVVCPCFSSDLSSFVA